MAKATAATPMVKLGFEPTIFFASLLRSTIESEATPVSFCHPPGIRKDSNRVEHLAVVDAEFDQVESCILVVRT